MDTPRQKTVINNTIQSDINLPRMKIKQETNLFPAGRLASLKLPRDLSLGGSIKIPKDLNSSKKKIYTPNLNITRSKTPKNVVELSVSARKRGRETQSSKNRNKPSSNFIQSKGVFSEGAAKSLNKRVGFHSERNNFEDEASCSKPKPAYNKKLDHKINKIQEKFVLDELLRDDYDPNTYVENEVSPIDLPFDKKCNLKIKEEFKSAVKLTPDSIDHITQEQNHKFFLFQFPDSLPGRGQDIEATIESKGIKRFPKNRCTIHDLSEGLLGKIIMHKSGKSKFVIGNMELNLEAGVPPVYQQNVVSAAITTKSEKNRMVNMGPIFGSLVTFPDWSSLLEQTKAVSNQSSPYSMQ